MKKVLRTALLLLVVLVGVSSCGKDEPDGKWENMKWEDLSGLTKENGVYIVPATGGAYTFKCKNYKPWIDHCEYGLYEMTVYTPMLVYNDWFEVKCDGNDVIVTFQPLEEADVRHLNVVLTAGDIFDYFYFEQRL